MEAARLTCLRRTVSGKNHRAEAAQLPGKVCGPQVVFDAAATVFDR